MYGFTKDGAATAFDPQCRRSMSTVNVGGQCLRDLPALGVRCLALLRRHRRLASDPEARPCNSPPWQFPRPHYSTPMSKT